MHLVNDINLIFPLHRGIGHFVDDFPDIVHAVIRRGVYLDHVDACAGCDGLAASALPAWTAVHRVFAVDGLRKELGDRRLARAARTRKQIGMSDAVRLDLVSKCRDNMVLSLDILKEIGTEFSV
jgi:hypothetical protein